MGDVDSGGGLAHGGGVVQVISIVVEGFTHGGGGVVWVMWIVVKGLLVIHCHPQQCSSLPCLGKLWSSLPFVVFPHSSDF